MGLFDMFKRSKAEKDDDVALDALEYRVESVEHRVNLLKLRAEVILKAAGRKNGDRQSA